ncbi:MAG: PHB depolymerase family esterase [Chloroflexota bacterium]
MRKLVASFFSVLKFLSLLGCALVGAVMVYFTRPLSPGKSSAKGPPGAGFHLRSLLSGGLRRVYGLYVPRGLVRGKPVPLVISLAGFGMNPAFQRYVSRWDEVADKHRFLVAYPQGSSFPLRFNAGPVYKIPGIDDVQMVRDLIAELDRYFKIDRQRVYVNGMSGGAHMADRLACELAGEVAAAGMVAGSYLALPRVCTPQRAMPVIAFQGTADPTGAYRGRRESSRLLLGIMKMAGLSPGEVVEVPAFEDWAAAWARRNGCDLAAAQWEVDADVRRLRYPNRENNGDVEIYVIDGGGHAWPGGSPTWIGRTSDTIHASELMWAFFESHPLSEVELPVS